MGILRSGALRAAALAAGLAVLSLQVASQTDGEGGPETDHPDRIDRVDEDMERPWGTPATGRATRDFAALDRDGDGRLSRHEVRGEPALHPAFDTVDLNGDNYLSEAEYRSGAAGPPTSLESGD